MATTLRHNLSSSDQKRGSSKSPDTISQGGHSPNFDAGVGVGGTGGIRGIEAQIVSSVFKTLVTKLVNCKELKNPDHMVRLIYSIYTNRIIHPFNKIRATIATSDN